MERACIELDTKHINTPLGNRDEILLTFAVAKAAWLFFTHVQKLVLSAYTAQDRGENEQKPPSLDEIAQSMRGMDFSEPDNGEGKRNG